jgi:hypothetical protein
MNEIAGGPRIEDFGITEEDLARAPCAFLASHRLAVLVVSYLVIAAIVFEVIFHAGASAAAAVYFTVVALAAASILLLPVLMALLCASERAEERWLCARFPKLGACLAYRRAVAEHQRRARAAATTPPPTAQWSALSRETMIEAVRIELERIPDAAVRNMDRETTGVDLTVERSGERVVVRCVAGADPVEASVGRELVAVVADCEADAGLIVSARGATPALARYIASRPLVVAQPWKLREALADLESLPVSSSRA